MMPIIESIRKGRSRRIGVGIGLNALGPVSRTVLVDCNYHFLFRMKDHESLWEAAKTLVLPPGAEAILPGLEPGECLFRGPAWPDATLVQIHANLLPPLPREIHYDTLPYVRSRSLREMPPVLRALQEKQAAHKAARVIPGQTSKPAISGPPLQFLSLACDMVGSPATEVFAPMGSMSSASTVTWCSEEADCDNDGSTPHENSRVDTDRMATSSGRSCATGPQMPLGGPPDGWDE